MPDTFHSASDLPLAKTDLTLEVVENGAPINRKVFAGQRVPPDLIEAYHAATAEPSEPAKRKPSAKATAPSE